MRQSVYVVLNTMPNAEKYSAGLAITSPAASRAGSTLQFPKQPGAEAPLGVLRGLKIRKWKLWANCLPFYSSPGPTLETTGKWNIKPKAVGRWRQALPWDFDVSDYFP